MRLPVAPPPLHTGGANLPRKHLAGPRPGVAGRQRSPSIHLRTIPYSDPQKYVRHGQNKLVLLFFDFRATCGELGVKVPQPRPGQPACPHPFWEQSQPKLPRVPPSDHHPFWDTQILGARARLFSFHLLLCLFMREFLHRHVGDPVARAGLGSPGGRCRAFAHPAALTQPGRSRSTQGISTFNLLLSI